MAAYTAYPRYTMHFNNSSRTGFGAAFLAVIDILILLGHGWALGAALYFASSFFERSLAKRKASWAYVEAILGHQLGHQ
jgi:hypothetical protein